MTYRGESQTESQTTSISGSFSTPVVTKKKVNEITAICAHDVADGVSAPAASASSDASPAFYSAGSSAVVQAAPDIRECRVTAKVTLLPKGGVDDNDDGALPNTGGSNLWLLVLGGALVVGGGGVTYAARRRHSSH